MIDKYAKTKQVIFYYLLVCGIWGVSKIPQSMEKLSDQLEVIMSSISECIVLDLITKRKQPNYRNLII